MGSGLEDLRMLRDAEQVADGVWKDIVGWDNFAKDAVGGQLVRAADSIGANIAEAFGRFHYGEKLKFLYYARGSLYETKFWFNRILARNLLATEVVDDYVSQLAGLARQLNAFVSSIKRQRKGEVSTTIREADVEYIITTDDVFFTEEQITWLETSSNLLIS